MAKAVQPSTGRNVVKILMTIAVGFGIIDDSTGIGIIDDPVVAGLVIGIINMIRHEASYRRQHGRRPQDRR